MPLKFFVAIFLLLAASCVRAQTSDPLVAIRVSMVSAQNVLAGQPLPNLDSGSTKEIPIQASYIDATFKGSSEFDSDIAGKFTGASFGFSYLSPSKGAARFFLLAFGNKVNGGLNAPGSNGLIREFMSISSTGYGVIGGGGYRLIGENKSKFSFGVFGGPAILPLKSQGTIKLENGSSSDFGSDTMIYGPMMGAQLNIRFGKFLLNPYGLYFLDNSAPKRSFTYTDTGAGNTFDVVGTFSAFGINIGYGSLKLNAFTKVQNDASMKDIDLKNYTLSYTFGME